MSLEQEITIRDLREKLQTAIRIADEYTFSPRIGKEIATLIRAAVGHAPGGHDGMTMLRLSEATVEKDAEIARLSAALLRLEKGFQASRNNASAMFRESGNVYHEGRRVAYDQAASDVRAALQGEKQ